MVTPTVPVLGVGAVVVPDPPVEVVYQFNVPPTLTEAVNIDATLFLQYAIALPLIPTLVLIAGAIGLTVTV